MKFLDKIPHVVSPDPGKKFSVLVASAKLIYMQGQGVLSIAPSFDSSPIDSPVTGKSNRVSSGAD